MQVGFTTTTFRNIKNIEDIVRIASQTGVDCIEWGADIHIKYVETAKRAKKLCDDAGIRSYAYGSYYRVGTGNKDEWRNICEIASAIGADIIRVWLGNADSEKTDDNTYKKMVEDAKSMCAVASEYKLTVCPECHDNTYNNNTDAFLRIRNDIGCDNFRTYFQSRYKKKDYDLDRIERTLPFIGCVHISYFDMFREQFPNYRPSYMNDILLKLKNEGYDGQILIEFTYPGFRAGFIQCLKKDIKRLKGVLK